jgi:hypothetical protein
MKRSSRILVYQFSLTLVLVALFSSCSSKKGRIEPEKQSSVSTSVENIPIIELPEVDLTVKTESAKEHDNPLRWDKSLPASDFIVRFSAKADPQRPDLPIGNFTVYKRTPRGTFARAAGCHVRRLEGKMGGVWTYEGRCSKPVVTGSAVFEVAFLGVPYLVRAVQIEQN